MGHFPYHIIDPVNDRIVSHFRYRIMEHIIGYKYILYVFRAFRDLFPQYGVAVPDNSEVPIPHI